MKNMKKIISALLMLCMMAALLCVPAFADDNTVSGMTITPASYNIPYGSTDNVSLQVQLQPLDATNIGAGHDIVWSLNGKTFTNKANAAGVASIQYMASEFNEGANTVTAQVAGYPFISASAVVNKAKAAEAVTTITLDRTEVTLTSTAVQLRATVNGSQNNSLASWISSNTNVAVVDANGNVTPVKAGTATITATARDNSGKSASCVVNVVETAKTTVSIAPIVNQLTKNQSINISASVSSGTARFDHWRVDSSMASFITLSNDASPNTTLTARAVTNTPVRLYAYADDGAYAYVEFTIVAADNLQIEAYPANIFNGELSTVYVVNAIPGEEFIWNITPSAQYGVLASSTNRGSAVDLVAGSVEGRVIVTATSKSDTSRSASATVYVNSEASYGKAAIKPDVASWSSGKLNFEVYPAFYKAYIDGKLLTPQSGYYTYYNNMLTLNPSLLATLNNGEHSLKVYTSSGSGVDGLVYATIYVNKAATASSVYGDNAHVRGSSYNLYFTSTDPIKDVYISNQWIDPANYSVDPTGKYLTLNSSFLNQLGYGSYTMKLATQNGYTETANFRIVTANYAPATGDNSNIGAWMLLLTVSCAGAMALIPKRKKSTDLM